MPMTPQETKLDRCYNLVAQNGRWIVAKVAEFVRRDLKFADPATDAPIVLNNTEVHFHWQIGGRPDAKWSTNVQVQGLRDFAVHASDEIACD